MDNKEDLVRYIETQKDLEQAIKRIMIFSQEHPCQFCAANLDTLCGFLKGKALLEEDLKCNIVWANDFRKRKRELKPPYTMTDGQVRDWIRSKSAHLTVERMESLQIELKHKNY